TGAVTYSTLEANPQELDPSGADAGTYPEIVWNPQPDENGAFLLPYPRMSDPSHPGLSYWSDGIPVSVDYFMSQVESHFPSGLGFALLEQSTKVQTYRWVQRGSLTITSRDSYYDGERLVVGSSVTIPLGYWKPTALSDTTSLSLLLGGFQQSDSQMRLTLLWDDMSDSPSYGRD